MSVNRVKDFLAGALGAIVFFAILYLPLATSVRYFLISLVCLVILIGFIVVAAIRKAGLNLTSIIIISSPTIILVETLGLNLLYDFVSHIIAVWVTYAVCTSLAMKLAARNPAYR